MQITTNDLLFINAKKDIIIERLENKIEKLEKLVAEKEKELAEKKEE